MECEVESRAEINESRRHNRREKGQAMTPMLMLSGRHAAKNWVAASKPGLPPPLVFLQAASGGPFIGRGRLVDMERLAWLELVHDGDPDCPDHIQDVTLWAYCNSSLKPSQEDVDRFMRLALHPANERTMIVQGHFLR